MCGELWVGKAGHVIQQSAHNSKQLGRASSGGIQRCRRYRVLCDDLIGVLATTTHPSNDYGPWHRPVRSPDVWTRQWAAGRILVATPGHSLDVLENPSVRRIIENGLLWSSRTKP